MRGSEGSLMSHRTGLAAAIALAAQLLVSPYFAGAAYAPSASASVAVAVTQPQPVAAGANFDYAITVSSEGPDDAENVALTFPLPGGVMFQAVSVPGGWSCTTPTAGTSGTVSCS